MKNSLLLASLVPCILVAGCAADAKTSTEPEVEKVYTTGSNIPRKKNDATPGVITIDKDAIDRQPMIPAPPSMPRG